MSDLVEPPVLESADYKPEAMMARFNAMTQPMQKEEVPDVTAEVLGDPKPEPKAKVEKPVEQEVPESVITGKKPEEEGWYTPPAGLKGKSHEHWEKIVNKAKEFETKAQQLEEKLKNPVIPDDFRSDFEATKARLAEREAELERVAVERSPKFQELFTKKEKGIKESFSSLSKDLGVDSDVAEQLLSASGKKRYEMIDDLDIPQSAKSDLTVLLRQKDELSKEKESFLSQSNEAMRAWQEEQQAQEDSRLAKLKQHEDRIFNTKLEALTKTLAPLQKIGDEKWDAAVETNIAEAKRFFSGQITAEEAAEYAIAGATAKQVYKMFEVAQVRLQKAEEELQRLKAASPSVESPGKAKPEDDSKMTFEERAMKTFREGAIPRNNGF